MLHQSAVRRLTDAVIEPPDLQQSMVNDSRPANPVSGTFINGTTSPSVLVHRPEGLTYLRLKYVFQSRNSGRSIHMVW
jgi:hypothetical protein